jgi:hypothetical protein
MRSANVIASALTFSFQCGVLRFRISIFFFSILIVGFVVSVLFRFMMGFIRSKPWWDSSFSFCVLVNPILCVEFVAPFSEVDAFLVGGLLLWHLRCVSIRPFLYTAVSFCLLLPS